MGGIPRVVGGNSKQKQNKQTNKPKSNRMIVSVL